MKISIVCAFEDEIKLLTGKMSEVKSSIMCGIPITSGKIGGHEINLCIGGIGKSNAAATTQFNISALGCDALLNIGLAGNCSSLPLGGAVVASKLVYHDYNMEWARESAPFVTYFTPDKRLVAAAKAVLDKLGTPYIDGVVATGEKFIQDSAVKADIVARTDCKCVEMEGAAFAHIAQKCGVPFAVIKVMSDNADEAGHDDFSQTISVGGYCDLSSRVIYELVKSL